MATGDSAGKTALSDADERDLTLAGFLTFHDPVKADAADALRRLRTLGVQVKIVTGDNDRVAVRVCDDLGLAVGGVLTGGQLDALDDAGLAAALPDTTVFARVTPEQKSRVINAERALGATVGFMGDGVNDAVAVHDADVGNSVDTATDVAKDAADIVLLEKDLEILARGIGEGRRIFANTIKYVLMGTSSIRTRRVPFFHSRPSTALLASTLAVVAVGFALPFSPVAALGFEALPWTLLLAILALIPTYLLLLEIAKLVFYRREAARRPAAQPPPSRREHRVTRRAARWTHRPRGAPRPARAALSGRS